MNQKEFIVIGKPKYKETETKTSFSKKLIKPKNRFRIYIQTKPNQHTNGKKQQMKSIMVYDFTGRLTAKGVKQRIYETLDQK